MKFKHNADAKVWGKCDLPDCDADEGTAFYLKEGRIVSRCYPHAKEYKSTKEFELECVQLLLRGRAPVGMPDEMHGLITDVVLLKKVKN